MGVAAVRFYDIAVSVHVMALVVGLGATFFYPVVWRVAKSRFPGALSSIFRVQDTFGQAVIGPSVALIIASAQGARSPSAPSSSGDSPSFCAARR